MEQETKRYYNASEHRWYNAGRGMTRRIDESTIFSGVPTIEQLTEWGYVEFVEPINDESNEETIELVEE